MFFRIPDNSALDSFRSYESFAEIFNPSVNKIWSYDKTPNDLTLSDFHRLLRSVFTAENIRANLSVFLPSIRNYVPIGSQEDSERQYDRFIKGFPEDLLWTLFFLHFDDLEGSRGRYCIHAFHKTKTASLSTPTVVVFKITSSSYQPCVNGAELYEKFEAQITDLVQAFDTYKDHKIFWSDSQLTGDHSGFLSVLLRFWRQNLDYYSNGQKVRFASVVQGAASSTFEIFDGDDYASYGYNFNIAVTQKVTKAFRDPLYNLMSYSTNPCKVLDWPIVEPGEVRPMLYGVELECAFDYTLREIIDAQYTPFFIAKTDSTITGSKRSYAEFVTVPMSLKALKRHYAHWFKNIDYSRFDVTRDTNNGMHVHMDRAGFEGKKHIQNLAWFYIHPANRDFLVFVSERGSYEGMKAYSPIPSIPSTLTKVKAYQRSQSIAETARGIVNFNKKPTIEIRMFRGIVSFAELCKNLEFVDAVFNFTRGEKSMNQLTAVHFLAWLQGTESNRYMTLKKFIDRCKNIDDLMTSCEVNDIVFNQTDPEVIRQVVNKSGLSLTNAHVTVLNRGRKRTFVLDRVTGELQIVHNNRSKLVDLDRSVEARYTQRGFAA